MVQGIKTVSFEEAVKVVKSGDRIHIHSVACAPQGLIQALCARGRAGELKNIKLQHLIRKALLLMQSRNSKVYSSWNRILSATTYGKRLRTVGQTIFRYTSVKPRN